MGDDYMQQRTTSAGYRFPASQRPKSSDFHNNCIPAADRQRAQVIRQERVAGGKPVPESVLQDAVTKDKVWKQSVKNEYTGLKQWEGNWGFLTEFDSKGRPKSPKRIPDKVNMFSSGAIPNTNSGNYGAHLNTEAGKTMQQLEFQFNSSRRKRKLGSEMVCY